jgi:hypothetical protein
MHHVIAAVRDPVAGSPAQARLPFARAMWFADGAHACRDLEVLDISPIDPPATGTSATWWP